MKKYPGDFGTGDSLDEIQYPCSFTEIVRKTTKTYCQKCGDYTTVTGTNVPGFNKFGLIVFLV